MLRHLTRRPFAAAATKSKVSFDISSAFFSIGVRSATGSEPSWLPSNPDEMAADSLSFTNFQVRNPCFVGEAAFRSAAASAGLTRRDANFIAVNAPLHALHYLANNPDTPESALAAMARRDAHAPFLLEIICQHPNAGPDTWAAAAANPRASTILLGSLLRKCGDKAREHLGLIADVAKHPNVNGRFLDHILTRHAAMPGVAAAAALNPGASSIQLARLVEQHGNKPGVLAEVARHPAANACCLRQIALHPSLAYAEQEIWLQNTDHAGQPYELESFLRIPSIVDCLGSHPNADRLTRSIVDGRARAIAPPDAMVDARADEGRLSDTRSARAGASPSARMPVSSLRVSPAM
jgi:hypothetical protein